VTSLSARFALPAIALLLAAAVPVWVRALAQPAPDACGDSLALDAAGALPGTLVARMQPPHGIDGEIAAPGSDVPLHFWIARTYEPSSLYFEPIGYFSHHVVPDALRGMRWLDAGGEQLPLHWRFDPTEEAHVIEYLFAQDGRPIRHPLEAGLANAGRHVWLGPRPVTLLLVEWVGPPRYKDAIERTADAWLVAAWQRYSAGCRE